jgi:hypothetical protein
VSQRRPWEPAPRDPGIRPGGIRDRAMRAAEARGLLSENPEQIRRSREYWAKYRTEETRHTGANGDVAIPPSERRAS